MRCPMKDNTAINEKNKSLSSLRLLKIMEALSEKRQPVRLINLSKELGLTQATVFRYLNALCTSGYAYQDPVTNSYSLSLRVCRLSDNLKANHNIRDLIDPFLTSFSARLNIGVLLAMEKDGMVKYIDTVMNPDNSIRTLTRIGRDAPIHSTASGKILLSGMSFLQVTRLIEEKGLPQLTEYTICDQNALVRELNETRSRGYALDNEECEIGHRCVSVPVYDYTGRVVAAVSAFDNTENLTDERIRESILPELKKMSGQVSYRLGFQPEVPFNR